MIIALILLYLHGCAIFSLILLRGDTVHHQKIHKSDIICVILWPVIFIFIMGSLIYLKYTGRFEDG